MWSISRRFRKLVAMGRRGKKGWSSSVKTTYFSGTLLGIVHIFCHVFATFPIKNTVEKYLLKWKDAHDTLSQKKQATKKNLENFPTFFGFVCTKKKMR